MILDTREYFERWYQNFRPSRFKNSSQEEHCYLKIVECVPNFSEGRRNEVIDAIRSAAESVHGITLLDCESDKNHNRTVLTFVGSPEPVLEAALAASSKAVELIDLTKHTGEHPRMGAVDVVPFVPLRDVTMLECIELARRFAKEFSAEFSVPVFLYEAAATSEIRKNLANVRDGQFEGLRDLIGIDPSRDPDFGPRQIHPTAGATAVGARPVLIAYNVNLGTQDVSVAKKIARKIRERDGGFPNVKALGFELKDRKLVQVSMNLTDYAKTSMHTVFDAISSYAHNEEVKVADSEIVGLVPQEALVTAARHYLELGEFRSDQIIENRIFGYDTGKTIGDGLDFKAMSLEDFSERVSSKDPVPGGGSVSAYACTLAASLILMVCRLTVGKKNYEEVWNECEEILSEVTTLRMRLLDLVEQDARAYTLVSNAVKLPKNTESEKISRQSNIKEALKLAIEIPSELIESGHRVLSLAKRAAEIGNRNAMSDAETAVSLARASISGAWSNIRLNLQSFKNDVVYTSMIEEKLKPFLNEV